MKELTTEEIINLETTEKNRHFVIISSQNSNADYYVGKYILVQKETDMALIKKGQEINDKTFIEHYFAKLDGCCYKTNKEDWIKTDSYTVTNKDIRVFELRM